MRTLITLVIIILLLSSCNSSHELMYPEKSISISHKKSKENNNFVTTINKFMKLKYANILGVIPISITNDVLYEFVDEWYGTKYRYGGTSKSGIDCSAFVQKLYDRVFNIPIVRTSREQFKGCDLTLKRDELREGDLIFFKTNGKVISHVGIYLVNGYFIHSSSSNGVSISRLTDKYWEQRYSNAGRILKS